jgi:hypothetical protein
MSMLTRLQLALICKPSSQSLRPALEMEVNSHNGLVRGVSIVIGGIVRSIAYDADVNIRLRVHLV